MSTTSNPAALRDLPLSLLPGAVADEGDVSDAKLETRVFDRIDQIPSGEWDAVYPDRLEGYRLFKTLEETLFDQFSFYYVMAYRGRTPVGAASCFLMNYPLDTTVQDPLKKITDTLKRFFPSLFDMRALICGYPMGPGQMGILGDDKPVFAGILKEMERIAKNNKVQILAFKDFGRAYAGTFDHLQRRGFYKFESLPNTTMDVRFKSFEEYLMTLSGATRYDLRRKFKKVDGRIKIDMEVTESLSDSALDEAFALFSQVESKGDMHFEKIPGSFFKRAAENMAGDAKYFVWRIDGKMVAFTFCLVSGGRLIDYYLGLDYSVAYHYSLYFVRFRDLMNWCIEHKITTYEMSTTSYEPKKRLDFNLIPLYVYAKHCSKWINPFFKIVCHFIKPERFESAIKGIKK